MTTDQTTQPLDFGLCPGCDRPLAVPDDCDHCEYFNLILADGRYHYCGKDSCYCRELRRTMKREVLNAFAERFNAERACAEGSAR